MKTSLSRQMGAEFVGTAFLLAAIVGSGIMGERLASGNGAIALLANTLATGAALVALILTFGSISGTHFNPAVTLADASQGGIPWQDVPAYQARKRTSVQRVRCDCSSAAVDRHEEGQPDIVGLGSNGG